MPIPATKTIAIESQKDRESPKPTRPAPKTAAAIGIILTSPRTFLRAASDSAEISAPRPIEPIRNPSVCGPPCSTTLAKIGISTTNGIPIRLTTAKSARIVRMGRNSETYVQPAFNSASIDVATLFTTGA